MTHVVVPLYRSGQFFPPMVVIVMFTTMLFINSTMEVDLASMSPVMEMELHLLTSIFTITLLSLVKLDPMGMLLLTVVQRAMFIGTSLLLISETISIFTTL